MGGKKKRSVAPRPKTVAPVAKLSTFGDGDNEIEAKDSPLESTDSSPSQPELLAEDLDSSNYMAIKAECEKALTKLRKGSHTKALKLIKEARLRFGNSAFVYRVQGTIWATMASLVDDPKVKQKHLRNAIDSAKKAVNLSPNSIEFSLFQATLLFEAANDSEEFKEVVKECKRGLAIKNPIDPAKERLDDEHQQMIPLDSLNKRIAYVYVELQSLIRKASLWMKTFGSGEEGGGSKTLWQHQAEDEERFKADLEKALRRVTDKLQARRKQPFASASNIVQNIYQESDNLDSSSGEAIVEDVGGADVYGTGLQNEVGEYNCFLNVIIQSLWNLRQFRGEFLRRSTSEHVHVGDPCVVCALYDILTALSVASAEGKGEAIAPTSLRIALSNLYPDSNFFQEGQMNDASEVLAVIFQCLHQSFTSGLSVSDVETVESNCLGSWDCSNNACIVHSLFGMDIFERMNCYNCGLESRHLKYTSFFHNINASALREIKAVYAGNSFDELLKLVEMDHQVACDPEASGCGKLNHIHRILATPTHVFTTVLGWQNTCETIEDIRATLAALATEIDISVLYHGLDPKNIHRLVSVVCYCGLHYQCLAYSHDQDLWIMYDDTTVKVIGTWENVLSMCERGRWQPQVLFYEAVN